MLFLLCFPLFLFLPVTLTFLLGGRLFVLSISLLFFFFFFSSSMSKLSSESKSSELYNWPLCFPSLLFFFSSLSYSYSPFSFLTRFFAPSLSLFILHTSPTSATILSISLSVNILLPISSSSL